MDTQFITLARIGPRWLTLTQASIYSGLGTRVLQNYIRAELIRSSNVCAPGSARGRRLVDRESLDAFIEAGVGKKTDLAMNRAQVCDDTASPVVGAPLYHPDPHPCAHTRHTEPNHDQPSASL